MKTCSFLSVKVSDIREAALARLVAQELLLKELMRIEAQGEIEYIRQQNNSFFRKLFYNFIQVPMEDELFTKFMDAQDAMQTFTLASGGWIYPRRSNGWWERLELLSKLPEGVQDMFLSVEDAKLVRLNEFMKDKNEQ